MHSDLKGEKYNNAHTKNGYVEKRKSKEMTLAKRKLRNDRIKFVGAVGSRGVRVKTEISRYGRERLS